MIKPTKFLTVVFGMLLMAAPVMSMDTTGQTQACIEVLQSEASLFEKARACQQLGESGTPEAVPALAAMLNHSLLSVYARTGLERIPGPEASAALRDALVTTQGTLKIGVIHSLAALRDEKAVTALNGLTRDADPEVARAALLALGQIANEQAVTRVQQALTTGPAQSLPDAAAACLLAAKHQLDQGKADTATALYDAVLKAKVPVSFHVGATRGAILSRTKDRIAFLKIQWHSKDPAIQKAAILTIRQNPSEAFATALNAEIDRAPRELQIQLIDALTDCHNSQSVSVLWAKVASDDATVRIAALRVLQAMGGPDSAPVLIHVLHKNRDEETLSLAVSILERLEGTQVDAQILDALSSARETQVRIGLMRLLGKRSVTSASDELLHQASDPDTEVSIAAFQALKSLAGPGDLPSLIRLTRDCTDESVRDTAANAVYRVCKDNPPVGPSGALILTALKATHVTAEKQAWIRVLALLGVSDALPFITATLQDTDQTLVQTTISSLSRWPDPSPINDLLQVVESDSSQNVRSRALMAVLQLATAAADETLASPDTLVGWFQRASQLAHSVQEKRLLISGLGRVSRVDSVQLLASYLDDPDVRTEAIHAMVTAAGPLVKGQDYKAIETVLKRISAVKDPQLQKQIEDLKRDIDATATTLNPGQ